ncbi:MAG: hypothetical protein Q9167_000509 [Letrouitia subvulpina]
MRTQYDGIGTLYNRIKELPVAFLERANVEAAIRPLIKGARVLDLACGTGYYSKALVEWGAESVVGVDISSAMVEAARKACSSDKISFLVGDCSSPMEFEGGPFDIVLGAWFLNYAPDQRTMTSMFRNIALNLKEGGNFIGLVWPPTDNPKRHLQKALAARPQRSGGLSVLPTQKVKNGVKAHLVADFGSATLEFDSYHLERSVYYTAAKAGGLEGTLIWKPAGANETESHVWLSGEDIRTWDSYFTVPHFNVLEISKG